MTKELSLLKVGYCRHPEAMVTKGYSWKSINFPAIVGLIKHPTQGYILFDTGYAKRFITETDQFPQRFYRMVTPMHLCDKEQLLFQLNHMGVAVEDIKHIFISHFHADHIAGLLDFPSARYICSREGLSSFQQRTGVRGLIKGYLTNLLPKDFSNRVLFIEDMKKNKLDNSLFPFTTAYDLFNDGACLAINLPGHAYGHFGLVYYDNSRVNFLIGDACWTEDAYKKGFRPNPLTQLIMSDSATYFNTIDKLGRLYGDNKEIVIIPSHCQNTYDRWRNEN